MTDDRVVLAHGSYGGDLVVMHLASMEQLAEFFDVLDTIDTVGNYNEKLDEPDGPLHALGVPLDEDRDDPEPLPPDTPFSLDLVPGYGDGYFPPNIWTAMLCDLEEGPLNEDTEHCILDLCCYHDSIGSLPSVELPGKNRDEIFSRLRAAGYTLVERQDLVDRLH